MADRLNRPVSIKVDRKYFDTWFEPERQRLSKKLGVNFTQPKFTAYLQKSGAKITYPKPRRSYSPQLSKRKNGGFRPVINF